MIDAVTAFLGIVPLLIFRIPQQMRSDTTEMSLWQDFRLGLRLVISHRGLLWLYGLTALSLFSTFIGLAGPVGLMLAAPLGEMLGVRGLMIGGGLVAALVCLAGFLSPSLMKVDEQPLA